MDFSGITTEAIPPNAYGRYEQGGSDFGGIPSPLQEQGVTGVTRCLLSYSKDTLLCSGEHKNPSGGTDWRELITLRSHVGNEPYRLGTKVQPLTA